MAKSKFVDGFVFSIPQTNIEAYRKIASKAGKIWIEHGALEYYECVGSDMAFDFGISFPKLTKAKPEDTVIFAWIGFKSRSHRDKVNAKVMADPRLHGMMDPDKPLFNMKRMSYGGFETIVAIQSDAK
jgi:uncharacterized protein YbaA (DUF1428 family)